MENIYKVRNMKIKTTSSKQAKHSNSVICVCWCSTEEVLSCSDDHNLIKWNTATGDNAILTTFQEDLFPTSVHLFPRSIGSSNKQSDLIVISAADGKFHIINQNGKIEKTVSAHQGACLTAQWSPDGAGLLTAGEDGAIRVWSKGGLLRSSIVQSDLPVYTAVWSPDCEAVLYNKGSSLIIKSLNSNNKVTKWKAHDGLILCIAWNANNNLIVSGAEDGYFKVWDTYGQQLSASVKHEQPISAVTWSPAGDLFFIGSYNLIRLCNGSGWSHCMDRPNTGTIYNMAWSPDGTQVAAACANGQVFFSHIIDREYSWKNYSCIQSDRQMISIKDILTNQSDVLEYPDRVVQIVFGFNHLVVATSKHCYIHPMNSWNTPSIFELKDGAVNMLILSERCICVVERATITVYGYTGRLLATPKWSSLRADSIGRSSLALGPDSLAVVDQNDRKIIHVFELPTGLVVRSSTDHSSMKLSHKMQISEISLSQTSVGSRMLAILDYNRDLYLMNLKDSKGKFMKLGGQVLSIAWSSGSLILAGLRANSVLAWCCPSCALQPDWLAQTTVSKEVGDLGRNPSIQGFDDGMIEICRGNGSVQHVSLVPFPEKLLRHVASSQWQQALKLCRTVEDETLWACLATLAWHQRELDVAEEAFAFVGAFHQIEYIQHLKSHTPEKLSTDSSH